MAEDRDARVEAAARAAVKEFQRQGSEYTPYVDLRDEADPSAFLIDGDVDLVQLAKAMLAAADAVSGAWVLVPREPTEAMITAGRTARWNIEGGYGGPGPWEAMIAAAPPPERGDG